MKVPEGWKTRTLGEVATIQRGRFSVRPRNDPRYYGGTVPFLQTGDVAKSKGVLRNYTQTLNEQGVKVSKIFPAGSLIMTIAANIGDIAEVPFAFACPDSLVVIRPNTGVSKEWLKQVLLELRPVFHNLAPENAQGRLT